MLSMIRWLAAVVFVGAFLGACSSSAPVELKATPPEKPNIIFFLLDDARTEDVATMDSVVELLKRQGTTFQNATLTDPLCCPSRATLLTGLYAHNHGIKDNNPLLGGGEQAFRKSRLDAKTYATALDVAGYKTGFFGKYLNGYKDLYIPPGWDRWAAHIGAFNGKEWNNQGHRYTSPHAMRDAQTALRRSYPDSVDPSNICLFVGSTQARRWCALLSGMVAAVTRPGMVVLIICSAFC